MKKSLLIFVILFSRNVIQAQNIVWSGNWKNHTAVMPIDNSTDDHKKHCTVTYVGECLFLAGGITAISGAIEMQAHKKFGDEKFVTATNVTVTGIGVAFGGIFVRILGKEFEKKHSKRFSVIDKKDQMGLAYNF